MGVSLSDSVPILRVGGLSAGGRGVARHERLVWLVEGAVPGDLVEAKILRRRPRLVEARISRLLEGSPRRREAPCPLQRRCGGCPWMVLPEADQRDWKQRILSDCLARIGRLKGIAVEETVASPADLAYRNKVELTLGVGAGGQPVLGYHALDPDEGLIDIPRCLLQDEVANRALEAARAFFLRPTPSGRHAWGVGAEPMRVVLRRSRTGRVLVALRGPAGPLPEAATFARAVRAEVPEVESVVRLVSRSRRRGGAKVETILGQPWIEECLGGTMFRLPAATFWQVNPGAADRLASLVAELAGAVEGTRVLELYGGVGVFSLCLARRGARAVVCEADSEAVECGRSAARSEGRLPVAFVHADVGTFLRRDADRFGLPGLVVADPPRSGFGGGVAEGIVRLAPRRIVLVSCDPATFARDARSLAERGYAPRRVVPIDMFPQTPHVEAVMLLEKE